MPKVIPSVDIRQCPPLPSYLYLYYQESTLARFDMVNWVFNMFMPASERDNV